MSRNGNNSPSMDLNELLRKHDEYKQRQARMAASAPRPQSAVQHTEIKPQPVEPQPVAEKPVIEKPVFTPPVEEKPVEPQAPVEPAPMQAPEDIDIPSEAPAEEVNTEHAAASEPAPAAQTYDETAENDEEYDEDDGNEPNPFTAMASVFRSALGKLRRKPKAEEGDLIDEADEEYESAFDNAEPDTDDPFADEASADDAEEPPKKQHRLFSWRKKKEPAADFIYDDSDFAADDYVAEEFPKVDPEDESMDFSEEPSIEPEELPEESTSIAEDIPEQAALPVEEIQLPEAAPAVDIEDLLPVEGPAEHEPVSSVFDEVPELSDDFNDPAEEADDEDETDDDEDEETADDGVPKKSLFKRFINLFIVREDEEEDPDTEDENGHWNDSHWANPKDSDESVFDLTTEYKPIAAASGRNAGSAEHKGGTDMDEKNRVNTDMTELLASGLESQGMSRRQRRELAEKQAAEAAAKLAAEEAAKIAAAPAAPAFEPLISEEPVAEEPAVEEPAASEFAAPDEPTRIFKPLTSIPTASTESEPAPSIPGFDDEDDEEEEEEAPVQKRRGFGLFSKKHAEEPAEDEDEDEEDFDEDEEEEEAPRKSRGLFGKKSRPVKYEEDEEDEEDFDDDEDEDDFDDEDDYDEYDDFDDEDEEDDYDDDEDDRPLGLRIIGFFKGLFAFILCVLIVVCALNVLDYFNVMPLDSVFEHHYNKAPAVFDTLFPSHNLKQLAEPSEGIISTDPIDTGATQAPTATDAPVVTMEPAATDAPEATTVPAVG